MALQELPPSKRGRRSYGGRWSTDPCISVSKYGITLNKVFCQQNGVGPETRVAIYVDAEQQRIAVSPLPEGSQGGYSCRIQADNADNANSAMLKQGQIAKMFPDKVGRAFVAKATKSKKEALFVASLDDSNEA